MCARKSGAFVDVRGTVSTLVPRLTRARVVAIRVIARGIILAVTKVAFVDILIAKLAHPANIASTRKSCNLIYTYAIYTALFMSTFMKAFVNIVRAVFTYKIELNIITLARAYALT
jgi:hypothetical protein